MKRCPECEGIGRTDEGRCPTCGGSGIEPDWDAEIERIREQFRSRKKENART